MAVDRQLIPPQSEAVSRTLSSIRWVLILTSDHLDFLAALLFDRQLLPKPLDELECG